MVVLDKACGWPRAEGREMKPAGRAPRLSEALVLGSLGGTTYLFPPAVAETWGQLWLGAACTSWKEMVCRKTPCLGFSSLPPKGWCSCRPLCTHSGKRGKWPGGNISRELPPEMSHSSVAALGQELLQVQVSANAEAEGWFCKLCAMKQYFAVSRKGSFSPFLI